MAPVSAMTTTAPHAAQKRLGALAQIAAPAAESTQAARKLAGGVAGRVLGDRLAQKKRRGAAARAGQRLETPVFSLVEIDGGLLGRG